MKHPLQKKSTSMRPTSGGTTVRGPKMPKRRHGGMKKKRR